MKNERLQQSELLAKRFAPYRAEAPLLSVPEIEQRIAGSATADHPHNAFFLRRLFMTLSGLAGLAAISYFAFFNTGSQRTQTTYVTQGTFPQSSITASVKPEITTPEPKLTKLLRKTDNPRGPWSAGNDQFYADLSPEELAKLGIVVAGDTIIAYKLPANDTLESMHLTAHSIGGGNGRAMLPPGVIAPKCYPVLMTHNNGHGAAFVVEENGRTKEWGMVGDDSDENMVRNWLKSPGNPGYILVWYTSSSFKVCDTCAEIDKLDYGNRKKISLIRFFHPLRQI